MAGILCLPIILFLSATHSGLTVNNIEQSAIVKDAEETQNYLNHAGIYPAYHMNKKHWVSILLDDTLTDDFIKNLIDISYSNS